MADSVLTNDLFRAGMPTGWRVADKSGAGKRGTRNDVGILRPPGGAPILISVFYTGSERSMAAQNAMIADVAMAAVSMAE